MPHFLVHSNQRRSDKGGMNVEQRNWSTFIRDLPQPYEEINLLTRAKDWSLAPHQHDHYQFIFVSDGILRVTANGDAYTLKRGSLCAIPPQLPHSLYVEETYSQLGINMARHDDGRGMVELLNSQFSSFVVLDQMDMLAFIADIEKEIRTLTRLAKMKIAGTLDRMLTSFIDAAQQDRNVDFGFSLLSLLNSHLTRKITLKDISKSMSINPAQLERLCHREFGCSVIEMFNQLRLNKACTLLADSHMSIDEISEHLGFYDAPHFSRFFKQKTSMNPTEYRRTKS